MIYLYIYIFFFFLYGALLSRIQVLDSFFYLFLFFHSKGVLASSYNKYVAVKKLDNMVREVEREFKTEVIVIGQKLDNLKNNKKG